MLCVGIMSGTSLDGVDAALLEIEGCGQETKTKLIGFKTIPMPTELKEEIKQVCKNEAGGIATLCSLNFKLGHLYAKVVKELCREYGYSTRELDYVASHGQTVWHIPYPQKGEERSTLQIGEPAVLAFETGVQVISNFRTMDIASGGQGAPLVPYSEFLMYGEKGKNIALLNLGGIGNITILPASGKADDIMAFDTGPGNMVIDEVCKRLFGLPFDDGGKLAAEGVVAIELIDELAKHPYLEIVPPKSTGRELFGEQYGMGLIECYRWKKPQDTIATATYFTARCIGEAYRRFIVKKRKLDKFIIGGGGAHNTTLIKYIQQELPDVEIVTQEAIGYSSDAKEAIAFAILGNETLHGRPSNIKSATGAKFPAILGQITPRPYNIHTAK